MPKQCLAVPKRELEKLRVWQKLEKKRDPASGFLHAIEIFDEAEISEFLDFVRENGTFHDRYGAKGIEENPEWQQIIFYALFVRGEEFFVYKRALDQSENRLASKISVGIGGHIEPHDTDIISSLYREIDEEIMFMKDGKELAAAKEGKAVRHFKVLFRLSLEGLIKDELDKVGNVHTGLFCIVEILDPAVEVLPRDPAEIACGRFVSRKGFDEFVAEQQGEPEGWTRLVLEARE